MNRVLLTTGFALVLSAMPASAQQQPAVGAGESGSMKKVDPPTNPSPRAPANEGATTGTTMGPASVPAEKEKSEEAGKEQRPGASPSPRQ
jgi:hypothetical protein